MHHSVTPPALAVDCTGAGTYLALLLSDGRVETKNVLESYSQAAFLIPTINEVLHANGLVLSDVKTLFIGAGPGSFTGMRVGLSFARTLHTVCGVNTFAFDSFQLRALQADAKFPCSVVIDTRRDDVFVQEFDKMGHKIGAGMIKSLAALSGTILAYSDMADRLPTAQTIAMPDLSPVFAQDVSMWRTDLSPDYLREAETSTPKTAK